MLEGGLEVLSQSEDVAVCVAEVSHGLQYLFLRFTEPEHHAGLGVDFVSEAVFDLGQNTERPIIGGAVPDRWGETSNRLQVVVEDVGPSHKDRVDGVVAIQKIRSQYLDHDSRIQFTHCFDGAAEVFGSPILEVIPGHGRDHHVLETHATGGLGHSLRLVLFQCQRFGGRHRAESAGASAAIAGDHEGRRALAPALPMIGALGTFAHRVETQAIEQRARGREGTGGRQLHLQPFGQTASGKQRDRGHRGRHRGRTRTHRQP